MSLEVALRSCDPGLLVSLVQLVGQNFQGGQVVLLDGEVQR